MNQPESISDLFADEVKKRLNFKLPVDECDLEDSDFDIEENNETFADKKLEKKKFIIIPFETKQAVSNSRQSSKLFS